MASIINASTSGAGGVITTADASGELQLQSGGNAVVSFTNTGGTAPRITFNSDLLFQSSNNDAAALLIAPSGTSKFASVRINNAADINNCSWLNINSNLAGTAINITSSFSGTGSFLPLNIAAGGATRASFQTNGDFLFNSGYGSAAVAYGCRAWVNFNGTGTVAIRASGNVSSITDRGTGKYTVNFTTAMPDANYCINGTLGPGNDTDSASLSAYLSSTPSTSSVQINSSFGPGFDDRPYVLVSIHR